MLILTRRVGETLMMGDDITVTVLGVKSSKSAGYRCAKGCGQCIARSLERSIKAEEHAVRSQQR